ncbi:MAG: HD domain-containing protein, partial [Sarcina sp.]
MIYRIKQFIWAFQSFFKGVDYKYVKRYLNEGEFEVFDKLSKVDKVHSIKVSKENLKLLNELKNVSIIDSFYNLNLNKIELAKVGLLHDIGKIQNPI